MIEVMSAIFVAAQGAVIFGSAFLFLRAFKMSYWLAKFLAMLVSYVAWVVFTVIGYGALGGGFGMMHGGLLLFGLTVTALISSVGYLLVWTFWGPILKAASWRPTQAAHHS